MPVYNERGNDNWNEFSELHHMLFNLFHDDLCMNRRFPLNYSFYRQGIAFKHLTNCKVLLKFAQSAFLP